MVKSQAHHAEGPGFAARNLQKVQFPVAAHHTKIASEAVDRPHCHGFLMVKIPSKFEIHWCET